MKVLVICYSQTGKTKKVAEALVQGLQWRGDEVELVSIEPVEEKDYETNIAEAKAGVETEIKDTVLDVSSYDLVCIGTPVWASAPAPAVNGYIAKVKGVDGKSAVCFATHAGGGADSTLTKMEEMLGGKGAIVIDRLGINSTRPFAAEQRPQVEELISRLAVS